MMPSLLVVASMTVTEVTTRIAIVGGLALIGLLFLMRNSTANNRHHGSTFVVVNRTESATASPTGLPWLSQHSGMARWLRSRPRNVASRATFLLALAGVSGLALGVGLTLALLALLNGLTSGLN
jgi:hypothetical protein